MSPRVGPASLPPTARMIVIAETVERLGSQRAAARALGISAGGIGATMAAYRARTGGSISRRPPRITAHVNPPPPGAPPPPTTPPPAPAPVPDRLEVAVQSLADQVTGVASQVETLLAETRAIAGTISDLLHRQPLILEVRPSQQRKADGGMGGAQESRRVRRVVG